MRKGEITRERLLAEATRLVQQQGVGATSVNDLLTATGVTKGALYFHFSGKDDLCLAVLEQARDRFLAFVDERLVGGTPRDALAALLIAILERHRARGFAGGCLFGNTALEMCDHDARYGRIVRSLFAGWEERISRVIQAGQEAGQMTTAQSADKLARMVVATIEGSIMLSRVEQAEPPLRAGLETVMTLLDCRPVRSL